MSIFVWQSELRTESKTGNPKIACFAMSRDGLEPSTRRLRVCCSTN